MPWGLTWFVVYEVSPHTVAQAGLELTDSSQLPQC